MNMSKNIGALRLKVSELASDLHEARADVELYARLKAASDRHKTLQSQYSEAMSALRKAEIESEKAYRDERFVDLSDIQVIEIPSKGGGGLLHSNWRISYSAPRYDGRETKVQEITKNGFEELEPRVLAFLIQKHPDRIPASIQALAPGDPAKAISKLIAGKRRGYLSERAVA